MTEPLRPNNKAPTDLERFGRERARLLELEGGRTALEETLWECPEPGCESGHVRTFTRDGAHAYVTTRTCGICEGRGTVDSITYEAWCRARAAKEAADDDDA
jgi:hypothetical protein